MFLRAKNLNTNVIDHALSNGDYIFGLSQCQGHLDI